MTKAIFAALAALLATPALACPSYDVPASFGAIRLDAGFLPDPYVRNITAGGSYDLAGCFGVNGWGGSVASAPDFELSWNGSASQLTIAAEVPADAVLLINDPNGEWFFEDDVYGTNPVVTFRNPVPGVYDIWIGAYDGTRGNRGQLVITERPY
jgi:hypothetical protein